MIWAILGILYLRARQKAAADPAKRARALEVARTSGLLDCVRVTGPAGAGWTFRVGDGPALARKLRSPPATAGGTDFARSGLANGQRLTANGSPVFRHGHWYWIHAATVNCSNLTDCRDYRSIGGVYGPGSLQVVLNERTGEGFFDYDDFSPYDGWRALVQHAGEI